MIDENGEQVGIVKPEDALRMARENELDLVEIVAIGIGQCAIHRLHGGAVELAFGATKSFR